ncbi:host-nuclease inhibitor Gam family protein [Clostridium sp. MB40-C1]|uniref:host-nuclease inhibitor Gam family protein n=1 Tax=Clostridium sp. MB40-C1 TaxID=3070996 RepID=UPI0027E0B36A|nr:host-nuclease inhibitor Gam family protein [Clostridium sp. MB40-C1]WMJ81941.1 host-nuclease inhibitor Gam family protein [Clostridium sp. MB40-C1]
MLNTLLKNEIDEMNEVMEEEVTGFKVDSLDSANWCFRKIRALKEQIKNNKALADAEKMRIAMWEKKENESAENSISYFENLLTEYFKEEKSKDKKFKLSTPYGKVSSRKATKWNYNEKEVLEWAKNSDYKELIRIKEELDKSTLKKTFKDGIDTTTGEIIPGVEIKEEETILVKAE